MDYQRMPIEIESPEEIGYQNVKINLAESSVAELTLADLGVNLQSIKLEYTSHRGHEKLRTLISGESKHLHSSDILLTGGAAMALFIIHTSMLTSKDHLIVIHPNYSSNLEGPKAIGCAITRHHVVFENKWKIDFSLLESAIQANTKLISITSPHNPTGQILEEYEIQQLKKLAEKFHINILIDETYRDACFKTKYPILGGEHPAFISVLSFSKGYGLPGIRIGAIITKNQILYDRFLAAKEMIQICNPPLEEQIAYEFYKKKEFHLNKINAHAQTNLEILKKWLNGELRVQAIIPQGGVVCFLRMNDERLDYTPICQTLLHEHGTLVGPGHWFDLPDRFMRIGFGYTSGEVLREGLKNISEVLEMITK